MKLFIHLLIIFSVLSVIPVMGMNKFKEIKKYNDIFMKTKGLRLPEFKKTDYRDQKYKAKKKLKRSFNDNNVIVSDSPYISQESIIPNDSFEWQKNTAKKGYEMYKKRLNEPINQLKVRDSVRYGSFSDNLFKQKAKEKKQENERLSAYPSDLATGDSRAAQDYLIQEEGVSELKLPTKEEVPFIDSTGEVINLNDLSAYQADELSSHQKPTVKKSNNIFSRWKGILSGSKKPGSTPSGNRDYSTSSRPNGTFQSQLDKFTYGLESRVKKDLKKYFNKENYDNRVYNLDNLGEYVKESIEKEKKSFKNVDSKVMEMGTEKVTSEFHNLIEWNAAKQKNLNMQLELAIHKAGGDIAKGVQAYKKEFKQQHSRDKTPFIDTLNDLAIDKAVKELGSHKESEFGGINVFGEPESFSKIVSEDELLNRRLEKRTYPNENELPDYPSDKNFDMKSIFDI